MNQNIYIISYEKNIHQQAVIDLILGIQQGEFNIPITVADQPDLLDVENFYQSGKGDFWCAVNDANEVVGTIALIDVGEDFGTIRKMFVRADSRGKELGIAQRLLENLEKSAFENGIESLYLGTVERLKAAQRFYLRNGFHSIDVAELPTNFLRMRLDTLFFRKDLK